MGNLKFIDKVSNSYIVILVIGFLFIGTIPTLFNMTEDSLSIPFRVFVLGLSMILIFKTVLSKNINKIDLSPVSLFFIFWVIYGVRIVFDLYLNPIQLFPGKNPSEYFQFAIGVVLIPSIATVFLLQAYRIDIKWILKWIYRLLFITLSIALFSRAGSDLVGRSAGDIDVGIISFGQFGATLSILSAYSFARKKVNFINKIFYIFGFLIGCIAIFVSASKSPFVALTVVIAVFFILWYGSVRSAFMLGTIGLFVSEFYIDIITFLSKYFHSNFLDRLLYTLDLERDDVRGNLLSAGFNEFLENPLFGNAILIQKEGMAGSYPHNLIVEVFMATGIVGGVIFILWLIKCIKTIFETIKAHSETSWIALLFLQYLILGMVSSNLYSNSLFWLFSILLVMLEGKKTKKKKARLKYKFT